MICSPCISACNVPICTDEIIIGTITSVNTDVKIIIENKTTGRKQYVSTQSDGAGLVTLVTASMGLMADQTYEISVLLATAVALCDTKTLTIGESTASCVSFQFENIKDSYGCQITFASQTLTPNAPQTPGLPCICVTQAMWDGFGGGGVQLLAQKLNVDCSTMADIIMDFAAGVNMSNVMPMMFRVDYVSGTFDGAFVGDVWNGGNSYFFTSILLQATFNISSRNYGTGTNFNFYPITGDLTLKVLTPSGNPNCVANFFVYGIKI